MLDLIDLNVYCSDLGRKCIMDKKYLSYEKKIPLSRNLTNGVVLTKTNFEVKM